MTLILAGLGSAFGQTPATLNLSRDLVTYGISGQNMAPDTPSLDARPLFEAGIAYASKNHIPTVTADRGGYYFLSQNGAFRHALLNAITNVTVDLQYSDLYFARSNIVGIQAVSCVSLTLKNFTIDYLQLPFTQLTVTGVAVCPQATLKHRDELRLLTVEGVHIQVAPVRCATGTVEQVDCCVLAAVPEEITIGDGNERKVGESVARLAAIWDSVLAILQSNAAVRKLRKPVPIRTDSTIHLIPRIGRILEVDSADRLRCSY